MTSLSLSLALALLAALAVTLALLVVWLLWRDRRHRGASETKVDVRGGLQHMRAIGQLSVFKAVTKEIVTETDHTWGDFGAKYLSWVLSRKKMAMIFEFELDFRYDLRGADFAIELAEDGSCHLRLPACHCEAHIRDIRFYDEQKSKLLPWLLPDLLNGFLTDGFAEEDKNRLVAAAKTHAAGQANRLMRDLQPDVQASARATLQSIARAFGADQVTFTFADQNQQDVPVGIAVRAAA